jgi:hypothetical protein
MSKRTNNLAPALKHGVYSGMTLLPGEDPAAFDKFRLEIMGEYKPTGRSEMCVVENVCRLMWRKQNLLPYRLAKYANQKMYGVSSLKLPHLTDEEAKTEFGAVGLELVEIGYVATTNYLLEELSITERLDNLIDRCLKRLLFIRGLKSISSHPSAASSPLRIGKGDSIKG